MSEFKTPSLKDNVEKLENSYTARMSAENSNLPVSVYKADARVLGQAINDLYAFIKYQAKQIIPITADKEHLERHTSIEGFYTNEASKAFGKVAFKGTIGAIIPANTILLRSDGAEFIIISETALTATNQDVEVDVEAVLVGSLSNCDEGDKLNLTVPLTGINSETTVISITAGADIEPPKGLLNRYLKHVQKPPHGGAAHDYEQWALDVAGVTRAWPYSMEMGLGTVTLRIMSDNITENGIPSQELLDKVKAHIEEERPVTVKRFFVEAPIADALNFEISGVSPATEAVKEAINIELKDLILREAEPGEVLLISHIREAISLASGEHDYNLASPASNIEPDTGHIVTMGEISWT